MKTKLEQVIAIKLWNCNFWNIEFEKLEVFKGIKLYQNVFISTCFDQNFIQIIFPKKI